MNSGELTLTMERFCLGVEPINMNVERRKKEECPATPSEITGMRRIAGAAQWRGNQGAPHILPMVRGLQRRVKTATVKDVHFANKVDREIRCTTALPMHTYRCQSPVFVA